MDAIHKRTKIGIFILASALITTIIGFRLKTKHEKKLNEITLTQEQPKAL